jgi:hypothetical protein
VGGRARLEKKIWTSSDGTAAVPWSGHGRPRPPPSPGGRIQYSQEGGRARLEEKFGQVGIAGRGIPVTWRADSV